MAALTWSIRGIITPFGRRNKSAKSWSWESTLMRKFWKRKDRRSWLKMKERKSSDRAAGSMKLRRRLSILFRKKFLIGIIVNTMFMEMMQLSMQADSTFANSWIPREDIKSLREQLVYRPLILLGNFFLLPEILNKSPDNVLVLSTSQCVLKITLTKLKELRKKTYRQHKPVLLRSQTLKKPKQQWLSL